MTKRPPSLERSIRQGLHYSVTIEAMFGSALQRDVAKKALDRMLASWKSIVEAHHKKNYVKIIHSDGIG
jgi:hypothetical protein